MSYCNCVDNRYEIDVVFIEIKNFSIFSRCFNYRSRYNNYFFRFLIDLLFDLIFRF